MVVENKLWVTIS